MLVHARYVVNRVVVSAGSSLPGLSRRSPPALPLLDVLPRRKVAFFFVLQQDYVTIFMLFAIITYMWHSKNMHGPSQYGS